MLMVTPGCSGQGQFPPQSFPAGPHFKKDVKIYGTNSTSPLASTKVPKNEPKRTQNELEKRAENAQKGQNEPEN
jgi:hypothetical protein